MYSLCVYYTWEQISGSSLVQRQGGMDPEPSATEMEFVLVGASQTEQEIAQALPRMPLEDESQSADAVVVTLLPGTIPDEEKDAADPKRNQRSGYKTSLKFLKELEGRNPESLTAREKKLRKEHE